MDTPLADGATADRASGDPEARPRWEWRIVAPAPSATIAAAFAASETLSTSPAALEEIYVLSAASPTNVKIRADRLDVKVLEDTSPDGLERWRTVLKRPFPIDHEAWEVLWRAWGVPQPISSRREYTVQQLLNEVAGTAPVLRAVAVTKRRTRLAAHGCPGERAWLAVEGQSIETFALEHEDPALVAAAVRALGLETMPATNYPAALKRLAGMPLAASRSPLVGI